VYNLKINVAPFDKISFKNKIYAVIYSSKIKYIYNLLLAVFIGFWEDSEKEKRFSYIQRSFRLNDSAAAVKKLKNRKQRGQRARGNWSSICSNYHRADMSKWKKALRRGVLGAPSEG